MPRVVLGYGRYKGYRLSELPREELEQLEYYYPLNLPVGNSPESLDLMVTIAVHAELQRRKAGGSQERRAPTLRDLALEIVDTGFRQMAKRSLGQRNHVERMLRLTQAKDFVLQSINSVTGDVEEDGLLWIPDPAERFDRPAPAYLPDDEVPF
jgi:hypothetical protein